MAGENPSSPSSVTMTMDEFDAASLHIEHIQCLIELAQGRYQSAEGPLVNVLTLMKEQLHAVDKLLIEAGKRA